MENATLNATKSKSAVVAGKSRKFATWMKRNAVNLALALCFVLAMGVIAIEPSMAALEIEGINDLKGLATTIVGTLGFIIAIYGGIQFGLGMANDNPDSQSRGLKMLIGGVIIGGATVLVRVLKLKG